ARYRIELDLTRPTMTWTALPVPRPRDPVTVTPAQRRQIAAPIQSQKRLEQLAKMATTMFARKGSGATTRGFVGIELADAADGVRVVKVLSGSPAQHAGLAVDNLITHITLQK